ncbi:MAG: hypothetical protein WD988_02840 [Candidatus Curtissbacteria bacterium]
MTVATAKKPILDDSKVASAPMGAKEQEPGQMQEAAAVAEIKEVSDSHDKEALRVLRETMPEVKSATPKIEISPDVADAGVKSPEAEAGEVVANGPTVNVDITEDKYEEGLKTKVIGKSDRVEKTVVGTASIVAMALWVGRLVKLAHKHTMRVVFRKGGE